MNRDLSVVAASPRPVRWDVKVQLILWPLKWISAVILLLAPIVAVLIATPYKTLRLALSETATAPSRVSVTRSNSGKYRTSSFHYEFSVNGKTYAGGGEGVAPSQGTAVYVVSRPSIHRLDGYSGDSPRCS